VNAQINAIYQKIKDLEEELEDEFIQAREKLNYRIEGKRILFENSVAAYHRSLRKTAYRYFRDAHIGHLFTAPVIYSMVFPIAVIDLTATIYQSICFPVYGIEKVPRSEYMVIDRHKLLYLNIFEKLNCVYCGYANGVFGYVMEIGGATENYWCPIKHARRVKRPHPFYHRFTDYGDAEGFRERMSRLRRGIFDF